MEPPVKLVARRYLQPMREGGSLPGVVETDDGMYVVKFRGAGQGPRALVAELIVAGLARALELPVPDAAPVVLEPGFGAEQEESEIRELLERSVGVNVGLRYLDGAFNYQPGPASDLIDGWLASRTVWLDALTTNPDRTARNPNLLVWERRPWLIDHGSALYAHHAWETLDDTRMRAPFPMIRDHVLLLAADELERADEHGAARLSRDRIDAVLDDVPDELLTDSLAAAAPAALRARYADWLERRLEAPRAFAEDAVRARDAKRAAAPTRLPTRR